MVKNQIHIDDLNDLIKTAKANYNTTESRIDFLMNLVARYGLIFSFEQIIFLSFDISGTILLDYDLYIENIRSHFGSNKKVMALLEYRLQNEMITIE